MPEWGFNSLLLTRVFSKDMLLNHLSASLTGMPDGKSNAAQMSIKHYVYTPQFAKNTQQILELYYSYIERAVHGKFVNYSRAHCILVLSVSNLHL